MSESDNGEDDDEDVEDDLSSKRTPLISHCELCNDNWPPSGFYYDIDIDRNPNVEHVKELRVGLCTGFHDRHSPELLDRLLSKMPKLEQLE